MLAPDALAQVRCWKHAREAAGLIRPETRAAQAMRTRPHARHMRLGLPDLTNPFFPEIGPQAVRSTARNPLPGGLPGRHQGKTGSRSDGFSLLRAAPLWTESSVSVGLHVRLTGLRKLEIARSY